jgi:2-iminobutanoate/2-iminopropanoate deaminase
VTEILFVTDMDAAFAAVPKARREHYPADPVVANSIIQIQRLGLPEFMIEIRCVAKV